MMSDLLKLGGAIACVCLVSLFIIVPSSILVEAYDSKSEVRSRLQKLERQLDVVKSAQEKQGTSIQQVIGAVNQLAVRNRAPSRVGPAPPSPVNNGATKR